MSFNALVGGADCGPVNALSQMVKHSEADRSLQMDRAGSSASGSRLQHLPPSAINAPNAADAAMARQFFEGPAASQPMHHAAPFQLPGGPSMSRSASGPIFRPSPGSSSNQRGMQMDAGNLSEAWARGGLPATSDSLKDAWNRSGSASQTPIPTAEMQAGIPHGHMSTGMPFAMGMQGYDPLMMPMRPHMMVSQPQQPQANWDQEFSRVSEQDISGKGKGKMTEDLEEAFKKLATDEAIPSQKNPIEEATNRHPDYMSDFQKVWDEVQSGPARLNDSEYAKWEAEYTQVLQAQREEIEGLKERDLDFDYTSEFNAQWEKRYGHGLTSDMEEQPMAAGEKPRFDDEGIPTLAEYTFVANNPNLALPAGTLLASAKEFLANNGSLSEAALMLEAAIQKGELGQGGYEAWILLGETRSMDEREDVGLVALQRGVQIAKDAGAVGVGMLSLAVSYTNEGFELAANSMLREWLLSKYPTSKMATYTPNAFAAWHSREIVREAFLDVAQTLHTRGESDPDVQAGLGILFYTDQMYDKAKDCFEAALWARPEDYLLWNRLGSCLSNGSKPEEALTVYREALRLRPTYTRAIFNVGVACLNIGAYKEAAEHFLSALASQKTRSEAPPGFGGADGEGKSEQLWKILKKSFSLMERGDLAEMADKGDVEVFRGLGFEF